MSTHHYHPKKKRNEIIDDEEKRNLLKWGNHVTIALCDENVPYIVTLSYGYDEANNLLYFHSANKGEKIDFVRKNSNVCATLVKDNGYLEDQCEHDYESLIIRGEMTIVDNIEEKKYGLWVLLKHLEKNPTPILERNIKSDKSYNAVTILKLNMQSVIGKKYIG